MSLLVCPSSYNTKAVKAMAIKVCDYIGLQSKFLKIPKSLTFLARNPISYNVCIIPNRALTLYLSRFP